MLYYLFISDVHVHWNLLEGTSRMFESTDIDFAFLEPIILLILALI